ncbi:MULTISPECIES: hypothetical protein [Pseudomonas]|uniref:Uncharacterized protein n=1 Tax=Pseudomonas segetis TaxID=298908 RepID=A0A239ACJ6_9PSED|nr:MULTISPECIES: hypothetical protein [Pseudomonas]SNR92603.1 hypothetical protein SAMN05216255_1035 [Pseudomonas segetis]
MNNFAAIASLIAASAFAAPANADNQRTQSAQQAQKPVISSSK